MTIVYLGSLTVGGAVPGADIAVTAGMSGINAALPNLQAQLDALALFVPSLALDFTAQLQLANTIATAITAAIAAGLTPPSLGAQMAEIALRVAALEAMIGAIGVQLDVLTALVAPLAVAGVHGYAFDGAVNQFGSQLGSALSGGLPGGSPGDHANAVVLVTSEAAALGRPERYPEGGAMNSAFADSMAAQLPTLSRMVDAPVGALAYGIDLACVTDIDPYLREVDPESPQAIVEAVTRRYITPRGALLDDDNYGLDVRAHLNRGATQQDLRAISGALRGEAQKDDRVAAADVTLVATLRSSSLAIHCSIAPADPELQDFEFTIAVTSSDVLKVTIV